MSDFDVDGALQLYYEAPVRLAAQLPAALDEIDRLRADPRIANEASAELLHQASEYKRRLYEATNGI